MVPKAPQNGDPVGTPSGDGPRMGRPSAPPAQPEPAWMSGGAQSLRRGRPSTEEPVLTGGGGNRTLKVSPGSFEDDYPELRPERSLLPRILLALVLVGGVGGAALWYFVLREKPAPTASGNPPDQAPGSSAA
jgi:hypothetical protein